MTVRVRLNRAGVRDLLRRDQTRAMLRGKAEAVADAARAAGVRVEGVPGDVPLPVTVEVTDSGERAQATIAIDHPAGTAVEAKHRLLGRAIDAARRA